MISFCQDRLGIPRQKGKQHSKESECFVKAEKGNLNRPEDAWAACSHALTDPWLADRTAPEYGQLRRRFLRLSKKLGRVRTFLSQNGWFVCPLLVSKRSFCQYRLGTINKHRESSNTNSVHAGGDDCAARCQRWWLPRGDPDRSEAAKANGRRCARGKHHALFCAMPVS